MRQLKSDTAQRRAAAGRGTMADFR